MTEPDISWYIIESRRIDWPNPDATCLEGGCGYCNDGPWKTLAQIERYARGAGVVPNRGIGEQDALDAYQHGLDHQFYERVDVRTSRDRLERWARGQGSLALKAMAEGMPKLRESDKPTVIAWMLRYRRDVLEESYRLGAYARHVVTR